MCRLIFIFLGTSNFFSGLARTEQNRTERARIDRSHLQGLLATSFDRQQTHGHKCSEDQSTTGVDWRVGVRARGVNRDDGCKQAADAVEAACDTGSRTAVRGGEDFRGICIKNAVHDVLEERLEGGADKLSVGVGGGGEAEQDNTCYHRRNRHRAFTTDVLDINGKACQDGAGNSDDGRDGVVTVDDVCRGRATRAVVAEVLRQEGVEKRVAHANCCPAEPQENGWKEICQYIEQKIIKASNGGLTGESKPLGRKERSNLLSRELGQGPLDNLPVTELLVGHLFWIATNLIENVDGEPGLGSVLVRDAMDSSNGLLLAATREKVLGRLIEVEEEETADEHEECDGTKSEGKISPAHVLFLSAWAFLWASIVRDESPGKQTTERLEAYRQ